MGRCCNKCLLAIIYKPITKNKENIVDIVVGTLDEKAKGYTSIKDRQLRWNVQGQIPN